MEREYILGRIGLYFGGVWGDAELFLGFGEQRQNTFRELSNFLSGIWGDQCITFR